MHDTVTTLPQTQAPSAPLRGLAAAAAPTVLQQIGLILMLALGALLLLSVNDIRSSIALLHSAATCWPGRIAGHR